jgi:drug/metabolite transporter (DMT)-like permease
VKPALYLTVIREHWKLLASVTFLQMLVNYIFFYIGLDLVPGALGAVIVGSQPLVVAVVAAIMNEGERLTGRKVATIILGISGVILISAGRQALRLGNAAELLGVFFILVANTGTACGNVIISRKSNGVNPFVLSSFSLLSGGILIYLVSMIFEKRTSFTDLPGEYWLSLAWLSFMAACSFSIWYKLLQRPGVKVSELNLWKFIIPVAGAVLSWILVPGERMEWLTVAGMIIITASLVMFYRSDRDVYKGRNEE